MANRVINNNQTVTDVVAPRQDGTLNAIADFGEKIIDTDQQAKITENLSKAQLDMQALNNQYQIQNEADPLNPKALDELKTQQKAITDSYGENISPLFRRAWQTHAMELNEKNDLTTQAWGYEQTRKNSLLSVNQSMINNYQLANNAGSQFGNSMSTDLAAAMDYQQSRSALEDFGNKTLGATSTQEALMKYKLDYAKSFIAGVAETNPKKAFGLLDDPNLKDTFTGEQRDEFIGLIAKTQKKNELAETMQQAVNANQVTDLVNDPNQNYFQKRLQIDKMELGRQISTTTASNARRVLTSQKDVDTVTSTPEMADIITKIYDINSNSDTNSSDYLNGVQNIHNLILEKQAAGKLTQIDAGKLNNEMKTLTSKKVADATKMVGNDNYEAVQTFNTALPPEYRGQATRDLFYETNGQNLTPDQIKGKALKVIDNINTQRRQTAVKNIKAANMPDADFLKTKGYTMQDVSETAAKYNISPETVIMKLRAKQQ